jgi:hypothetical protein
MPITPLGIVRNGIAELWTDGHQIALNRLINSSSGLNGDSSPQLMTLLRERHQIRNQHWLTPGQDDIRSLALGDSSRQLIQ